MLHCLYLDFHKFSQYLVLCSLVLLSRIPQIIFFSPKKIALAFDKVRIGSHYKSSFHSIFFVLFCYWDTFCHAHPSFNYRRQTSRIIRASDRRVIWKCVPCMSYFTTWETFGNQKTDLFMYLILLQWILWLGSAFWNNIGIILLVLLSWITDFCLWNKLKCLLHIYVHRSLWCLQTHLKLSIMILCYYCSF